MPSWTLECYAEQHIDAASQFNQRLRESGGDLSFLIPESLPPDQLLASETPVLQRQWVLTDGEYIRGGVLLQDLQIRVGNEDTFGANVQTPVTEGLFNPKFAFLGAVLAKQITTLRPLAYAVGMGSMDRPFPRLIKGMRWRVEPVPFFFRVCRGDRFLREIGILKTSPGRRAVAILGSVTGLGHVGMTLLHMGLQFTRRPSQSRKLRATSVSSWGEWTERVWQSAAAEFSFSALRDHAHVTRLHKPAGERFLAWRLETPSGELAGWTACLMRQMNNNPHFGSMRVGTILDALALPGFEDAVVHAAWKLLREQGADLVVANHTHQRMQAAFGSSGFLNARSNYLLGVSPALRDKWQAADPEFSRGHITRADGDGRIHL